MKTYLFIIGACLLVGIAVVANGLYDAAKTSGTSSPIPVPGVKDFQGLPTPRAKDVERIGGALADGAEAASDGIEAGVDMFEKAADTGKATADALQRFLDTRQPRQTTPKTSGAP